MIYMVCGPIGAGKTTIAHRLAEELGAIRFSEDEWLSRLFVPDAPSGLMDGSAEQIVQWATGRYVRCREQIWQVCEQLIMQGKQVVLDGGLSTKEQRDELRDMAIMNSYQYQLHYVDADYHIRKNRVIKNSQEKSGTFPITVTPALFDFMEEFFEPPVGEELTNAVVIKT